MEKEGCHTFAKPLKGQVLGRVHSETSNVLRNEVHIKVDILDPVSSCTKTTNNEVENAECECCGMTEECTPTYIGRVKGFFCGKWVCGLCSEAVKEKMKQTPDPLTTEEALESHTALCKQFNRTVRLNPKLTLAAAMRDIARKSFQHRSNSRDHLRLTSKIGRTMSCVPRIDGC